LTSSSSDLLEAFRWFIGPLRHKRVPVDDVAFTLSLAIRFIPLVEQEFESVRMAQKARAADSVRSFRKRLGVMGQAFATMFVNLFRQADRMADAMDARCYGSAPVRTRLPKVDSDVA
ncbi:MAG: energy-coupling factor transporter transmembrane protein EcfT, partial [Eggerthellaceae bacterium]|nr:energy-coupling factor transporter transmembrane protein EcfT [Eggerthellaceae bacterium]